MREKNYRLQAKNRELDRKSHKQNAVITALANSKIDKAELLSGTSFKDHHLALFEQKYTNKNQ